MDSRITVFLIVVLLAMLRGILQRPRVRREMEGRLGSGLISKKARAAGNQADDTVDSGHQSPETGVSE